MSRLEDSPGFGAPAVASDKTVHAKLNRGWSTGVRLESLAYDQVTYCRTTNNSMSKQASQGWQTAFRDALNECSARSQLRSRTVNSPTAEPLSDGTAARLDFGSNDYLGLRGHPSIQAAVAKVIEEQGWGSGASPVLSGYSPWHARLEQSLAELCDCEAALVFSSGFSCNVGSLACLVGEGDVIYSDALNHASLIDGMRLSKATRVVFPHNDATFVESHLRQHRGQFGRALVVTESVFSMDGDRADLTAFEPLALRYDCGLVVDEAHATGVYGEAGGGLLRELGLSDSPALVLKLGTLSKAIGGIGGFAAGTDAAIQFLVNRCRSYLFSTAPPAAAMAAAAAGIELLRAMDAERLQLREQSSRLRTRLREFGWNVPLGDGPIVPVIVGREDATLALHYSLLSAGIYVPAIRPPTVPPGSSRLRISLSTKHQPWQIDELVAALSR